MKMSVDRIKELLRVFKPGGRINPQELKRRLDAGEAIEILDVRHWSEVLSSGEKLPGARWVERAQVLSEAAPERRYVLYCN
jgi:hypothetical protein